MNQQLVKERAEIIFEILDDRISEECNDNTDYFDAYKATFALKHRSISLFRRAFSQGTLDFNLSSVEAVYETYCNRLPGYKGLSRIEKLILLELLEKIHS